MFPARVSSVRSAREFVRGELAGFPLVNEAVLCVSEAATNAVLHGSEHGVVFWVEVRRGCGRAYVAVIDSGGASVPRLVHAGTDDEHFRGLALVEAFADRWGAVPDRSGGYRVWFQVVAS